MQPLSRLSWYCQSAFPSFYDPCKCNIQWLSLPVPTSRDNIEASTRLSTSSSDLALLPKVTLPISVSPRSLVSVTTQMRPSFKIVNVCVLAPKINTLVVLQGLTMQSSDPVLLCNATCSDALAELELRGSAAQCGCSSCWTCYIGCPFLFDLLCVIGCFVTIERGILQYARLLCNSRCLCGWRCGFARVYSLCSPWEAQQCSQLGWDLAYQAQQTYHTARSHWYYTDQPGPGSWYPHGYIPPWQQKLRKALDSETGDYNYFEANSYHMLNSIGCWILRT